MQIKYKEKAMEILDIYDANGKRTGKTIERGSKDLQEGQFIKLAVVWIKCKNKFLIQKASSALKDGKYAVSGGHVPAGVESRKQAAVELNEELGIDIRQDKLKFLGMLKMKTRIFDVYLYEDDTLNKQKFTLQESEVDGVYWFTKDEIKTLIAKDLFRKSSQLHFEAYIDK